MPLGQEKDFGIETETLDALLLKNNSRPLPAKSLESALRVGKFDPQDPSHHVIEKNSGLLADNGLVDFNEAAVHRAGADGAVKSPSRE